MASSDDRRTELMWSGKASEGSEQPSRSAVTQSLERHRPDERPLPQAGGWCNRLIRGDNLDVMADLLAAHEGGVDLVYIDPPFFTGGDFSFAAAGNAGGDAPAAPVAYRDRWEGGLSAYLTMLHDRLRAIRSLLSERGSLYVHLDANVVHYVKVMMDEVFGPECFQREIIWRIGWVSGFKSMANNWIRNHDTLLYYVKDPERFTFNKLFAPYPDGYRRRDGQEPRGAGYPLDDVWNANPAEFALEGAESLDSIQIKSFSREKTGYPTQKNESLVARIVRASSQPGDLVADFFAGSGTTAVVSERLDRRWIAVDRSPLAVHTARKRLLATPRRRPFSVETAGGPGTLEVPGGGAPAPAIAVAVVTEGAAVRLRLTDFAAGHDEDAHWSDAVDHWMVGSAQDGVLVPAWWSSRTRRSPDLELVTGPLPVPADGSGQLVVQVTDHSGVDRRLTVTVAAASRSGTDARPGLAAGGTPQATGYRSDLP